ncbi:hypothetical protein RFI_23322 [Reticulomyxa filosa]|uniref:Proteasome activator PA28 C-terminal domain-containing protein n=1 Tax=Reticulomyxa filosa TaxID=46433 RepID=X6MLT7_RETFI|nr:hypothetical protein RFI_23322 [Reticulomyxa filosa]|eukprot:ETO14045.1 hypothetical protein RFI_23322 [Reticulomyxa filosa]
MNDKPTKETIQCFEKRLHDESQKILDQLPTKIIELDTFEKQLLETNSKIQKKCEEGQKKVLTKEKEWQSKIDKLFEEISVDIRSMHEQIKPKVFSFMNDLDKMVLFINGHVPAIEDGNNFGVAVQESIEKLMTEASSGAYNFLREIPKYYNQRSKMERKLQNHEQLEVGFYHVLIELDRKHALSLTHKLRSLKNLYLIIFDVITKNYQKIVQPKGHTSAKISLY